jgi:hypothetical protein
MLPEGEGWKAICLYNTAFSVHCTLNGSPMPGVLPLLGVLVL